MIWFCSTPGRAELTLALTKRVFLELFRFKSMPDSSVEQAEVSNTEHLSLKNANLLLENKDAMREKVEPLVEAARDSDV